MINIKNIIDNITDEETISTEDLKTLTEYTHKYRFFQIGYMLIAKKTLAKNAVNLATLYATDKNFFKKLMNYEPPFNICNFSNNDRFLKAFQNQEKFPLDKNNNESFELDQMNQGSYKNEILKREKKNIYNDKIKTQRNLMQNFISTKNLMQRINKENLTITNEDLSTSSYQLAPELLNENLLHLYINQGKIEEVLKIYKQIIEKNPEKKKIFDDALKKAERVEESSPYK